MKPETQLSKLKEVSLYSKLKKIPGAIKQMTGVSDEKFDDILKHLTPKFKDAEKKRLFKTKRKRAFGGGRKPDLDLDDHHGVSMPRPDQDAHGQPRGGRHGERAPWIAHERQRDWPRRAARLRSRCNQRAAG